MVAVTHGSHSIGHEGEKIDAEPLRPARAQCVPQAVGWTASGVAARVAANMPQADDSVRPTE